MQQCEICGTNIRSEREIDSSFYKHLCENCNLLIHHKTPEKLKQNNVFHNENKMKAFSNGEPMENIKKINDTHIEHIYKRLESI